jgi:peptidyl-prolyl cis-trans isomerase B (cyclophilin B)
LATVRNARRSAARARLEREMAARAAREEQRRRRQRYLAIGIGAAIIIAAVTIVVVANLGGGSKPTAAATPTPASSATGAGCTWSPVTTPSSSAKPPSGAAKPPSGSAAPKADPNLKDVGMPPAQGNPQTGTDTMTIATNQGPITVSIDVHKVPCATASFKYLADKHFFDNTSCYRMHNSGYFIVQCGDPTGTGKGGPTYTYTPENIPSGNRPTYTTGMVAVGVPPDSTVNASQFFLVYQNTEDAQSGSNQAGPTSALPGNFTVLGYITSGLDVVQKVAAGGLTPAAKADPNTGAPKIPLTISSLTLTNGAPPPAASATAAPSGAASASTNPG